VVQSEHLPAEKEVRYDRNPCTARSHPGTFSRGRSRVQQSELPDIRRFYSNSAFGEGWALYAESLGAQLGVYKDPPVDLASSPVKTSARFVLWSTRESTISAGPASRRLTTSTPYPQISLAEVDRYISSPAQALSYKLGELRILLAAAAKAEQQLGISSIYATSTTRDS